MDAQSFNNAADVLQREADRLQGLAAAATIMRDSASVLARVEEAEQTLEKTRGMIDEANRELEAALEAQERARLAADAHRGEAQSAADQILERGRDHGRKAIEEAQEEASRILASARERGAAMIASAQDAINTLSQERAQGLEALAGIKADIVTASAELDTIHKALREAREKVAALLPVV